jgi:hypothetical protein
LLALIIASALYFFLKYNPVDVAKWREGMRFDQIRRNWDANTYISLDKKLSSEIG